MSRPGTWWEDYLRDPGGTVADLLRAAVDTVFNTAVMWAPVLTVLLVVSGVAARSWRRARHDRIVAGRRGSRAALDGAHARRGTEQVGARLITVLAPPGGDRAGGEALWANLIGLLRPGWRRVVFGQPHLVWELTFSQTGVQIGMWVPAAIPPGLVERALEAAWPGARTTTSPAPPPLPSCPPGQRQVVVAGQLRLARPEALPIRTDFDADPVRALLTAATGLGPHEHAAVQILARPVAGRRLARGADARSRSSVLPSMAASILTSIISQALDVLTPGPIRQPARRSPAGQRSSGRAPADRRTTIEATALDRAAVAKRTGNQYATTIRYAVSHAVQVTATAEEIAAARGAARGRAHAIAGTFAVYTTHNRYRRLPLTRADRLRPTGSHNLTVDRSSVPLSITAILTERRLGRGDLLSVPELAAVAHLPLDDHVPGLDRAGARAVPPPPAVAQDGPHTKPLGDTDSGHPRPVALRVRDARHHLHVIGATGSGKSTLLANMVLADADAGRGIVLVDPKGDLVTDVLARLPRSAADRVVLLDADSRSRPPCLNPLDTGTDEPGSSDLAVENLVSVFRRIHSAFWGPRTDDVMRAACLTLRAQPGVATLTDLPRLLAEPAFRHRLTSAVTDPILRGFWDWYDELSDAARSQVISPLMNKLRAFLLRPFVRDALAAGPSTIDLPAVLDGGICLVRIPKGTLGDETTRLVGSLAVAATWHATTARANLPQRERRDACLVVDECHNFLNLPYAIEDMLAEARGFRLAMTLAHQHLGQLPRELRDGLSTNARSKIYFTAGPEDARDLARHTAPHVTEHDLAHLGAFHAAARLVVDGAQTAAFTLRTRPLPPPVPGRSREIRRATQLRTRTPSDGGVGRQLDLTKPIPGRPDRPTPGSGQHPPAATDPRRRAA